MKEYEIRYQSYEMYENGEWGIYYCNDQPELIKNCVDSLIEDPDIVNVLVYEINITTLKSKGVLKCIE